PELWSQLLQAVRQRPSIEIRWGTRAQRLVQDSDGRVTGVRSTSARREDEFLAKKGVVLASGGYEFDQETKLQFLKAPMHFYGNPDNTGDGLRMAQMAGADLWHMNLAIGRGIGHFELEDGTHRNFAVYMAPGGYIITD